MPIGDVRLDELAEAVRVTIEEGIVYLQGEGIVQIVDSVDPDNAEEFRKSMGVQRHGVRISFPNVGALTAEAGMGAVMLYGFGLTVTVLYRNLGNASTRMNDASGLDLTKVVKDLLGLLEGKRLGILNQGGLRCGQPTIISRGNSLQAMQFTVTARSREARS